MSFPESNLMGKVMLPSNVCGLLVHTGNLISCKDFKKATQTPTEEVYDSISDALNSWLKTFFLENNETNSSVSINESNIIEIENEERANLKVSVKVFVESFECKDLISSVTTAMITLGIDIIDSLILSFPVLPVGEKLTLEHIKSLWVVLENLVQEQKVASIGVSDLDTSLLTDLYNWSQIKPSVNHVNLESCCVMPPEMTAFARENDIQLLTHNDPKVLLTNEKLQEILKLAVPHPENWLTNCIVRYSVIIKCRGIIGSKGYLLSAFKKNSVAN